MNYFRDLQGHVATYIIVSKDIEDLDDLHLESLFCSLKSVSFDSYF